jgi:hypothetical protein
MKTTHDDGISIRNCRFAFKCEMKWDDLNETGDEDIRFCNSCEKEVYFCINDDELTRAVRLNRCVAFVRMEDIPLMGLLINKDGLD